MRVEGPKASLSLKSPRASSPTQSGASFSLPSLEGNSSQSTALSPVSSIHTLDALLALQVLEPDRPSRRKRLIQQGHALLDSLDILKYDLLSGKDSRNVLLDMAQLLETYEPSGDSDLDHLLSEILLRAEVELAKRGVFLKR